MIIGITSAVIVGMFLLSLQGQHRSYNKEREAWKEERQQLLDRIQAPSFDHLKHHEVKVIKAKNDVLKDPSPLEVV